MNPQFLHHRVLGSAAGAQDKNRTEECDEKRQAVRFFRHGNVSFCLQ
jgi:hypothetical protein